MKLALLILFLTTCFGLLVWLLIPSKKPARKKRTARKTKPAVKAAPAQKKLPAIQQAETTDSGEKIIMEEMRDAVRRFAIQNPGATAQVLQTWIKKKK